MSSVSSRRFGNRLQPFCSHGIRSERPCRRIVRDRLVADYGRDRASRVVFEGRFVQALEVRILNSYLTVDLGAWVCRPFGGQHKGTSSEELRRVRPVSEIAFV